MDQNEYKQIIKNTFDRVASGYDREAMSFFPKAAACIPELLALKGDEHILDVATGTGIAAVQLASFLQNGKVTGIDFSEGMLAQAQIKFDEHALENTELLSMDMQQLSFDNHTFDAINCSFGIFFVEGMLTQLQHMATKVKPGGKICCCSFSDDAFQPNLDLFLKRLTLYDVEPPEFRWKEISSEDKFRSLFESADLSAIEVHRKNLSYFLNDADAWWEVIWNAGFRGLLTGFSDEVLQQFKSEHLAEIQALASDEGVYLKVDVLFALGESKL